jgi:hypothetical protein
VLCTAIKNAAGDILKDRELFLEIVRKPVGGCYYLYADQSLRDDKEVNNVFLILAV